MKKPRTKLQEIATERNYIKYIFTGMRKTKGISLNEFRTTFNIEIESKFGEEIKKLTIEKLIISRNGFLSLTNKGINISNYVLSHFV